MGQWSGKVVLITGGGGGIGRAAARRFLEEGAGVFLGDVNPRGLEEARAELGRLGGSIKTLQVDLSRVAEGRRLVEAAASWGGGLDVLVNAAGIWLEGPATEMSEEMYDRIMAVNLKAAFFTTTAAVPWLVKTKGSVVNIASDAGLLASSTGRASLYSISKAGLVMLTRSLALELAPRQVRVNAVCPGDVDTPMLAGQARDYGEGDPEGYLRRFLQNLPQGEHARFIRPEEVAECILFLASPRVAAVTGACLSIDFGSTAGL